MSPASGEDGDRVSEDPLSAQIRQLYRASVQQVIALLDGASLNLEDCLFEIAYISEEPDIHKRCFNLMRELRINQESLRRGYARLLLKHLENWFQFGGLYAFASNLDPEDELKQAATRISGRAQAHLAPPILSIESVLTERLSEWHTLSSSVDIDRVVFPLAPQSLSRAFLEASRGLDLDPGQHALLLQVFRRYVLDRLGTVLPPWSVTLGIAPTIPLEPERAEAALQVESTDDPGDPVRDPTTTCAATTVDPDAT